MHHLLGFAWTNTNGRLITLFNWTGTAFFCALLVRRARGSWPLTLFVAAEGFMFLWIMVREPIHPGSTITLMVAAIAWLGWEMLQTGRLKGFAISVAIVGTLLALTKINVGVFLILSAGFWFVLSLPPDRAKHRVLLLGALGLVLPVVLMLKLLGDTWVQIFALLAGLATVGVVIASAPAAQIKPAGTRIWGWFVGTGIAITALVIVLMLPRDTSLAELWQGVIIAPLKHPGIYAFAPRWRPGAIWVALGVVALLSFARRRPDDVRLNQCIAWIRITATIAYIFVSLQALEISQGIMGLSYGLPLAGLFVWPLDRKDQASNSACQARAWLGILLVFQSLHAFPVAGSQLNWGTFLWVPLMALGFEEAVNVASASLPGKVGVWARIAAWTGLLILTASLTRNFVRLSHFARDGGEPLEQPGAERIYMPANYSSSLRVLAENVRVHGDMLLSLPGAYSFNLWTGVDTPTLANATHWFSLLTDEQQQAMIKHLESASRPVFIVQHNILADLMQAGFHPQGPLMDYMRASFHRSFAIEGDSLWVRNGRSIAPLSTATLACITEKGENKIELNLTMAPHQGEVARVEVWVCVGMPWRKLTLDASQTNVAITPLNLDGTPSGPTRVAGWPWPNDQIARITLTFPPPPTLPPPNVLEAKLFDKNGHRMASARIIPFNGLELPPEQHTNAGPAPSSP
ncbi:MAG TPA: hypothetical protein VL357_03855 [Rariglobus sp.]|nr:hypothetical protein [Rariglobus sp.]